MKNLPNTLSNWNEHYLSGDTPWRHEQAHDIIIELAEKYAISSAKLLEIGCGTGEEAIELGKRGFDLTAIDLAEKAIAIANKNAAKQNSHVNFKVLDFIEEHDSLTKFDSIIDVTCMHTFTTTEAKRVFANLVAEHLTDKGIWINLSCAKPATEYVEEATGVSSPPALTLKELAETTEGLFTLLEIQSVEMLVRRKDMPETLFPAWVSVFKRLA